MKMSTSSDSPYLAKENVPSPIDAIIAKVTFEQIKFRDKVEEKWVMHFSSPKLKPMLLNVGNRKTLKGLYGDDTDNYPGKPIGVWVNPNVEFEGEVVGGLRLRAPGQAAASAAVAPPPVTWTFEQAIAECAKVKITRDQLIAALKDAGRKGWQPSRDTMLAKDIIKRAQEDQPEQGFDDMSGREPEEQEIAW